MVDAQLSAADFCAAQIVDGQVGAALVLVLEPTKALGFTGFLVADEFEEDGLAELREYGNDVALGEFVWQAAKIDKSRIAVICVPGSFW